MTIKIICEDVSKRNGYIEHIVNSCLGIEDLPMKIILSSEESEEASQANKVVTSNNVLCLKGENRIIQVRGLRIDMISRKVWVNDVECYFTAKEFDLLLFLAEHPDRIFTKEELLKRMWTVELESDIAIVAVYIARIRKKVELNSRSPEYITTVWGSGYRFVA